MSYKVTALVILMLIPAYSHASSMDVCKKKTDICKTHKESTPKYSKYAKLQYNDEIFNNIGPLVSNMGYLSYPNAYGAPAVSGVIVPPKSIKHVVPYNTIYKPNYLGVSIAAGYSLSNNSWAVPRLEMEILYSKVDIDSFLFPIQNMAEWVALASTPQDIVTPNVVVPFLKNKGFTNIATMVSGYYDFVAKDTAFTSYIGIGGGITAIKFLGVFHGKFAYQGKFGIGYPVNSKCKIFTGYRYFGVIGDKFKKIKPTNAGYTSVITVPSFVSVSNRFGVHGLEAGVIFNF